MDAELQSQSVDQLQSACIRVFNDQPSAGIAAANLEANGIACWTSADDCGGLMPVMAGGGIKLFVSVANVESAIEILNSQLPGDAVKADTTSVTSDDPPRDLPKFIILAGIWTLLIPGLVGNVFVLKDIYFSALVGLPRFLLFWCLVGLIAINIYLLYRSLKNYLIQKGRSANKELI